MAGCWRGYPRRGEAPPPARTVPGGRLTDIGIEARADVYPAGHSRRTLRVDLARSMAPSLIASGFTTEAELAEVSRAALAHLADPGTLVLPHLLFLAWGRKPAGRR
ncbi:MAG TPA: hypothetical protein VH641_07365 [Streptosporangiaceae bacterium]|jgi:hypothetical protein